ncbi:MAG: DUF6476 family protein [Pseudomonadota bacterium]
MDEPLPEPENLRFLRRLVTVLTATMILGITTIVVLVFIRFSQETPAQTAPVLPDSLSLPDGAVAMAVTYGPGWYAVVTRQGEILIFDQSSGALRQTVTVK